MTRLFKKSKNGTITPIEQDELDRIQGKKDDEPVVIDTDPDDDYEGPTNQNQRVCSFPLGNASGNPNGCKQVAQLQLAINQTTNNMNDEAPNDYYCNNFEEGDGPLMVDGVMGARTLTAVKAYYVDDCCTCYMIGADNCTGCKITKSQFDAITNMEGADVSDEALAQAGWVDSTLNFSGKNKNMIYRNAKGTGCGTCNISGYYAENNVTDSFGQNLPTALNCNPGCSCEKYQYNPGVGRLPLTGFKCVPKRAQQNRNRFSGFSLPQYGKKYSSPLGDFYKQQYAFKDDYPKQSNYTKSYGLGKGYGFSGQQTERTSTITLQQYIDDVP